MAHLIDFQTGLPAIAFTGETPWHGLGSQIDPDASIEEWQKRAGLMWSVKKAPVQWHDKDSGKDHVAGGRFVIYRDDTHHPLNVVSGKYNIVQPREVLEFFRDLVDTKVFELSTAGSLKDGGKIWAQAKMKRAIRVRGNDVIYPYLLLASSLDGSLSTTGKFGNERVVCHNTLTMAISEDVASQVRVPHHSTFDPIKMKKKLGIIEVVSEEFEKNANKMAGIKLKKDDAIRFFVDLFCDDAEDLEIDLAKPTQAKVGQLYYLYKNSPGHDLPSADGTLWGAVNAVTRFVDFVTPSKSQDNRLNSAWFGVGDKLKSKAFDAAMKMAA